MAVSFQQPPKRILVRGVNWLGDAVMTTPALVRLREKFPEAHITLLTPEKLRDLYQHHPAVNEIASFSKDQSLWEVVCLIRRSQSSEMNAQLGELVREFLRFGVTQEGSGLEDWARKRQKTSRGIKVNFDLALILPNSPRSALEAYFARIPQRVGYARPWRNMFLTHTVPIRVGHSPTRKRTPTEVQRLIAQPVATPTLQNPLPAIAHQMHEYLNLVGTLGANPAPIAPALHMHPDEVVGMDWLLPQTGSPTHHIIGLNPGAEYGPAKRWPIERFAEVANELYRKISCRFLIFGGAGDVPLAEQLVTLLQAPASKGHVVSLAGKTNLRELMAGLKRCDVLLTNDTGPMHLAAALDTPVVVPFGSTSPELTGPGLPGDTRHRLLKSDAPCAPCFRRECPIDFRCMQGITVERVTAAVRDVFRH